MRRLAVITVLAGLTAVSAALPVEPENPNVVKLSPSITVAAAATKLAAAAGATVVVDPSIEEKVPATYAEGALEPGLTRIAALRRLQWRKVYLEPNAVPRMPNGDADAARLKAWAVALDALPAAAIGLENAGAMTVASRAPAASAEMQAWAKSRKPIYVLYQAEQRRFRTIEGGGLSGGANIPQPLDTSKMTPDQVAEAFKSGKPVAMDFEMARRLREMYPGLLPDIKMDLPEGANGRIVLMRQEGDGGGEHRLEIRADALELHEVPK